MILLKHIELQDLQHCKSALDEIKETFNFSIETEHNTIIKSIVTTIKNNFNQIIEDSVFTNKTVLLSLHEAIILKKTIKFYKINNPKFIGLDKILLQLDPLNYK